MFFQSLLGATKKTQTGRNFMKNIFFVVQSHDLLFLGIETAHPLKFLPYI